MSISAFYYQTKCATLVPVDLFIADADRRRRLTATIYDQLRDAVTSGRLQPGDRLPSSRRLAAEHDASRHTVTTVYGRLVAEGYLEGAAGGGTRVAAMMHPAEGGDRSSDHRLLMRQALGDLAPMTLT